MNTDIVPKGDIEAPCMPLAAKDTRAIIDINIDELWAYLYDAYIKYNKRVELRQPVNTDIQSYAYCALTADEADEDNVDFCQWLEMKKKFLDVLNIVLSTIINGYEPVISLITQYSNFYPNSFGSYQFRVYVSKFKNFEALIATPQKTNCRHYWHNICDITGEFNNMRDCTWKFTIEESSCKCGQHLYGWKIDNVSTQMWLSRTDDQVLGYCYARIFPDK